MRIIQPVSIDDTILTASNIAEDEYDAWDGVTDWLTDEFVIYEHGVYKSLQDPNVNNTPDDAGSLFWAYQGATNRFRMFDGIVSTISNRTDNIDVTLNAPQIINGLFLKFLAGLTVRIKVTDSVEGVVYDTTFDLQDNTEITSWYNYFFDDVIFRNELVVLDLPAYVGADVQIIVSAASGSEAECGEVLMGKQQRLGVTNIGTSIGIRDYSRKDVDEFGNTVVVERRFAKLADYDVTVETMEVAKVQNILSGIRAAATVFIGDEARSETVVYGFYRDFNIVIASHSLSDATIEVEGLT